MTPSARASGWLTAFNTAITNAGLPSGIGMKPDTTAGQPWAIITLLSAVYDGDIELFNSEKDALMQVRSVALSAEQANAACDRADDAVFSVTQFDGGVVVFRTRDTMTTPIRDDTTFPDRSVFYVDALYRLWLSPTL